MQSRGRGFRPGLKFLISVVGRKLGFLLTILNFDLGQSGLCLRFQIWSEPQCFHTCDFGSRIHPGRPIWVAAAVAWRMSGCCSCFSLIRCKKCKWNHITRIQTWTLIGKVRILKSPKVNLLLLPRSNFWALIGPQWETRERLQQYLLLWEFWGWVGQIRCNGGCNG